MPLTTRALTATYITADQQPCSGTVTFTPTSTVASGSNDVIIPDRPVEVALSASGSITVTLTCTDAPGTGPAGWAYTVTERIDGDHRSYVIAVPSGDGPLDLADIAPLEPAPPLVQYVLASSINQPNGVAGLDEQRKLRPVAQVWAEPSDGTTVPIVARSGPGNTVDLQLWRNEAGTTLARVNARGAIRATNLSELAINVRDRGATGDGSATNDINGFNVAISEVAALGGGTVYVPAGVYLISSPIALKKGVSLRGAGQGRTILKARPGLAPAVVVGASGDAIADLTISDLTIDGDHATTAANINGLQMSAATNVRVRDVEIRNCGRAGTLIQADSQDVTLQHVKIANVGLSDAPNGFGVRVLRSQRTKILNCRISGSKGMGINAGDTAANASRDTEICGNYIDMSASTDYEAIGVTADSIRAIITGNHCISSADNGISVSAAECVVTGNIVIDAVNSGIYVGGTNTIVSDNLVKNAGKENSAVVYGGITLAAGANRCVVVGNRVLDDQATPTTDHGVKESPGADRNLITGNVFSGTIGVSVLTSGAATIASNNLA